jgi:hypothetical protein
MNARPMTMITFSVVTESSISPQEICEGIFDVDRWSSFTGYGPLPGIKRVTMTSPANAAIGTVFHVENTDGSKHQETVLSLDPGKSLIMKMDAFGPPLIHLATHFIEHWEFLAKPPSHQITRTFELHPTNALAALPLWLIARLLKRAVVRHTHQIAHPQPIQPKS